MAVFNMRQKQAMYIPTNKLSEIKWNLIWQPIMCVVYMSLVLLLMSVSFSGNVALWAAGASSLASSAYCVFAVPRGIVAQPMRIIIGYAIACVVGMLVHFSLKYIFVLLHIHDGLTSTHFFWITASLSVGLAMVAMVFAGGQHPPAAGMSLVMAMDLHSSRLFLVIWLAIIILVVLRFLLRHKLRNLLE